ncbi:MAG: glycosyltransferase family 4 protein [bacterium]
MKVCFCAPGIYSFFFEDASLMHGGAEVQQYLIAHWLRDSGVEVSFITEDHGQSFMEEKQGFQIVKMEKNAGPAGFFERLIPNTAGLGKAMRAVGADVYYQRGRGALTGKVAYACSRMRKPFVFGAASDTDCSLRRAAFRKSNMYERMMFSWGLRHADRIIAQTEHQKELLIKNFKKEPVVISNCYPVEAKKIKKEVPPKVLWVGEAYRPLKRAEMFIRLAEALPRVEFIMVAGPESPDPKRYAEVRDHVSELRNVEFLGFVPYKDIHLHFERASILVDTSAVSGFHNTFLQAWANESPVVSLTVDPDELIRRYGFGCHSGSFDKLKRDVEKLVNDRETRERMGKQACQFVKDKLGVATSGKKYLDVFRAVTERFSPTGASLQRGRT